MKTVYRRVKEASKDIDFIIATEYPIEVREEILKVLPVLKVIAAGDTKVSITLDVENEVDVDFRLTPMLVGGFTTVTVGSVIIASILIKTL